MKNGLLSLDIGFQWHDEYCFFSFFLFPTEDNDRILEGSLMSSTEISFKFPLSDEAICSMDEICIPPPTLMQKKTWSDARKQMLYERFAVQWIFHIAK